MKLQKALKEKKKLAGEIAQLKSQIQQKNSMIEGSKINYAVDVLYEQLLSKIDELVNIKLRINKSNAEIQERIFKLSEYKGLINFWNSVSTTEGLSSRSYGDSSPINYVVFYNEIEKDKFIKTYQDHVDRIQEEIDVFNYTMEI